jgi:nicotinamidase-related amidase
MEYHLLIIDPQNDFCDLPAQALPPDPLRPAETLRPALPVAGADADMRRLAAFIERSGQRFAAIHVTLDSHHPLHIANPAWWVDPAGSAPAPFTAITVEDVRAGRWRARDSSLQAHSLAYVEALQAGGRYTLVVWPEHCLIGHWGHNVHAAVAARLDAWERSRLAAIDYVLKGSNPRTEHYSAVAAEVPDPADPGSALNRRLIDALATADEIVVAGEALSHCVAGTVRDIANSLAPADTRRLVLLRDCSSAVGGFESHADQFVRELTARGMRLAMSHEWAP